MDTRFLNLTAAAQAPEEPRGRGAVQRQRPESQDHQAPPGPDRRTSLAPTPPPPGAQPRAPPQRDQGRPGPQGSGQRACRSRSSLARRALVAIRPAGRPHPRGFQGLRRASGPCLLKRAGFHWFLKITKNTVDQILSTRCKRRSPTRRCATRRTSAEQAVGAHSETAGAAPVAPSRPEGPCALSGTLSVAPWAEQW